MKNTRSAEGAVSRRRLLCTILPAICAAACSPPPPAEPEPPAPPPLEAVSVSGAEPGWTGLTVPDEIIEARRVLMIESQRLMQPVEGFIAGERAEAEVLRANAATLEALMLALPHLFPPTTNLFDPNEIDPPTLALPAIWQRFPAFMTFAGSAERAAAALRDAEDEQALRAASERLRSTCDVCHSSFMRPYTPPVVTDEDLSFDFESVLPPE
jgi:cytochrome c556